MEREKAKEWSCMHAKYGWCEKYMEREKEEKNMDACIHAGISHGLACEKYITWCAESFLSIKSIFSSAVLGSKL